MVAHQPPILGTLQARILEWVAISFSSACKWKVKVKSLSRTQLFATAWTVAYQAPPSMGFPRQEYWNGLPLPTPSALCIRWLFSGFFFFFQHSTGASISVLPMNIQGCAFKIDCLNLLAVRDSQVFSQAPEFESINSLVLSLLNGLTLTSIHDYRKNHSLNYIDLHW